VVVSQGAYPGFSGLRYGQDVRGTMSQVLTSHVAHLLRLPNSLPAFVAGHISRNVLIKCVNAKTIEREVGTGIIRFADCWAMSVEPNIGYRVTHRCS
jgi:hypothetical protein